MMKIIPKDFNALKHLMVNDLGCMPKEFLGVMCRRCKYAHFGFLADDVSEKALKTAFDAHKSHDIELPFGDDALLAAITFGVLDTDSVRRYANNVYEWERRN